MTHCSMLERSDPKGRPAEAAWRSQRRLGLSLIGVAVREAGRAFQAEGTVWTKGWMLGKYATYLGDCTHLVLEL